MLSFTQMQVIFDICGCCGTMCVHCVGQHGCTQQASCGTHVGARKQVVVPDCHSCKCTSHSTCVGVLVPCGCIACISIACCVTRSNSLWLRDRVACATSMVSRIQVSSDVDPFLMALSCMMLAVARAVAHGGAQGERSRGRSRQRMHNLRATVTAAGLGAHH